MRSTRSRSRLGATVAAAVTAVALVGTMGGLPRAAADPTPAPSSAGQGTTDSAQASKDTHAAVSGAAPSVFKTYQLKGGYVAGGISLRNRGSGKIKISGIPSGSKIKGAYLLWSVLDNSERSTLKQGKFAGTKITGTKVGSGNQPCWPGVTYGYSYRADVTKKVKGNGTFALTGFASGTTNATDPWTSSAAPMAEGASLIVVFEKSTYPLTKVILSNGYGMVSGSAGGATATVPFGFAATNPVGAVKTTFIGGDGQSATEDPSYVNDVPIPQADWDGTDGPTPAYSLGNLWDTDTVALPNIVKPGDTSAKITVNGGSDCLIWTGQAFSIGVKGGADTDGDKLLDGWEANGYDANGDGIIDVNLPGMGASIVRKDLFVEMDYMDPNFLPSDADLARIVKVFATAPQAKNPNGSTGIRLHLDAGSARSATYNLGGGNAVPFDSDLNPVVPQFKAIKNANFNRAAREKIFYYMIWGNGYDGDTSSGNAFNIPSDSFLVTLGWWPSDGTPDQRVGTFIHEFGHALGQKHGGNDHSNYKPNYLSVMNYSFQLGGVMKTNGTRYFGYSSFTLPSLNEKKLNEKKGLRTKKAKPYRTQWVCPNYTFKIGGRSDKNLDWNCNKKISKKVSADINGDGKKSTLKSYNNWGHIVYGGGAVGGGASVMSESTKVLQELTLEEHEQHQHR